MKILPSVTIPTPFGKLHTLEINTPPARLPSKPDSRDWKALKYAMGQDVDDLFGLIPLVGDIISEKIDDMHEAEIFKILTKDEYTDFVNRAKLLPSTLAMGRTLLFKGYQPNNKPPNPKGLLPMPPKEGPPLPRAMGVKWPGKNES